MIRKVLRVIAAVVLFVVSASIAAGLTAKAMNSYFWRGAHRERRFRFDRPLARGERIARDDLSVVWLPRETPPTVPVWRTECVVEQRLLADVAAGDLVQPMVVESADECLRRDRPEEWSRD